MLQQEADAATDVFKGTIFETIRNHSTIDMLLVWVLWGMCAMAYGWGKAQPKQERPRTSSNPHAGVYKSTNCWGGCMLVKILSLHFHRVFAHSKLPKGGSRTVYHEVSSIQNKWF